MFRPLTDLLFFALSRSSARPLSCVMTVISFFRPYLKTAPRKILSAKFRLFLSSSRPIVTVPLAWYSNTALKIFCARSLMSESRARIFFLSSSMTAHRTITFLPAALSFLKNISEAGSSRSEQVSMSVIELRLGKILFCIF